MAVITLTSDYGLKDFEVAALKGKLYTELATPNVVDISHQIEAFNTQEAAIILRAAYIHFPEGSIHLICVDEEDLSTQTLIAMQLNRHYFIAPNNGVLSLLHPELAPTKLIEINLRNLPEQDVRSIFAHAAAHLARGGEINLLGREISEIKQLILPKPVARQNSLIGSVIYIDRFGNLITNLSLKLVTEAAAGRKFIIYLSKGRKVNKINKHHRQAREHGEISAIYNSQGLLEIAIFKGSPDTTGGANGLLGMRLNDQVNIEFI